MSSGEGELRGDPIPFECGYHDPLPVFFGHYWMTGSPHVEAPNAACLDFSVANGGAMVAYCWSGEQELTNENVVWEQARTLDRGSAGDDEA